MQHIDCSESDALVINNNPKGFSCYCHRCGYTDFVHKGKQTFAELMKQSQREKDNAASIRGSTKLPSDFTLDIPPEAMLWLLKASITPYTAREHGIGWSKRYERVVLPVYNDNNLVYHQMRAIHEYQTIKYLNPSVARESILFWAIPKNADTSNIVVTEDILSAIRVGKFIPTASAMGTKLSIEQASQLAVYDRVTIWLDPDEAGVTGTHKMKLKLDMLTAVNSIVTSVDPKNLTDTQIIEEINNAAKS